MTYETEMAQLFKEIDCERKKNQDAILLLCRLSGAMSVWAGWLDNRPDASSCEFVKNRIDEYRHEIEETVNGAH